MRSRVLAVVLAVATLGVASPASAETWSHRDPAGDMYLRDVGRAPDARQGDITSVVMNHQKRMFVLKVAVRELHAEHYSYLSLFFVIPHQGGRATQLHTDYYFSIDDGSDVGIQDYHDGSSVDCSPVTARRDYRRGTLRINVPQDCLGRRANDVRAGVLFHDARQTRHGSYVHEDDGLRNGMARRYGLSPALSRG